jgi:hypothetical protein
VFLALPGALKAFESYAIQPSTMPQIPIQDIVLGVYLRQVSPKISGIPPEKLSWILTIRFGHQICVTEMSNLPPT